MFCFGFFLASGSVWPPYQQTQYISCSVKAYELLETWLFAVFVPGDKMLWCERERESGKQRREGKTSRDTERWRRRRRRKRRRREGERTRSKYSMCFFLFLTTDTRLCSSGPCAGNATCIETGEGGYLCICPHGYTGEKCQLKRGLCLTNGYWHLLFMSLF